MQLLINKHTNVNDIISFDNRKLKKMNIFYVYIFFNKPNEF